MPIDLEDLWHDDLLARILSDEIVLSSKRVLAMLPNDLSMKF